VMLQLSTVIGLLGLGFAASVFFAIRKDRLHSSFGTWWVLLACSLSALGFAPKLFDQFGLLIGVAYPPSIAFTLAFLAILLKLLHSDIRLSASLATQKRLVQLIGLLEREVHQSRHDQKEDKISLS